MSTTMTLWKPKSAELRTARKAHRCICRLGEFHGRSEDGRGVFCETVIQPGDRYVESLDSSPAFHCWPCAEHQGLIAAEQPWQHRQGCLLPWVGRPEPRDCACGGELDGWYEEVKP